MLIIVSMIFLMNTLCSMEPDKVLPPDIVIHMDPSLTDVTMHKNQLKESFLLRAKKKRKNTSSKDRRLYRDAIKDFFQTNDPDILDLVEPYLTHQVQEEIESPVNIFSRLQEDSAEIDRVLHDLITQSIIESFRGQEKMIDSHREVASVSSQRMKYAIIAAILTTLTTIGATITAIVTNVKT